MQKILLICSKSTEKYFPDIEKKIIVSGRLTKTHLCMKKTDDLVIAVGGGAVIDLAKLLSKKKLICYPTTASGACFTSHSVVWNENKKTSVKTRKPDEVIIKKEFLKTLPKKVIEYTKYDLISHCIDSKFSINSIPQSEQYVDRALEMLETNLNTEELIIAGNLAGKAIEITPTTILHSLSYPITGHYDYSHGKALGIVLPPVCELINFDLEKYTKDKISMENEINFELVLNESIHTNKFNNFKYKINKKNLLNILKKT